MMKGNKISGVRRSVIPQRTTERCGIVPRNLAKTKEIQFSPLMSSFKKLFVEGYIRFPSSSLNEKNVAKSRNVSSVVTS